MPPPQQAVFPFGRPGMPHLVGGMGPALPPSLGDINYLRHMLAQQQQQQQQQQMQMQQQMQQAPESLFMGFASAMQQQQHQQQLLLQQQRQHQHQLGMWPQLQPHGDAQATQRQAMAATQQAQALFETRQRAVQARRAFCAILTNRAAALRKWHYDHTLRLALVRSDGVQRWHAHMRSLVARTQARRLAALRANDEEEYLRLVAESKDERLNLLLQTTADLLTSLGDKIKVTQAAAAAAGNLAGAGGGDADGDGEAEAEHAESPEGVGAPPPDAQAATGADQLRSVRANYASSAHAVQETLEVQPGLLVGGTLRHYQLAGVQWMLSLFNNNLNGILADEMGLGKTVQTIGLLAHLAERKGVTGPHLIICPKAVLFNWASEFAQWAPSLRVLLYDGKPEERASMRAALQAAAEYTSARGGGAGASRSASSPFCVLLTHYDLVIRDKAILGRPQWCHIIVDEGHRLKNRSSRLAELLTGRYKARHRLLLTGTPIQNNLTELWALLNFLLPTIFASSDSFAAWFNAPFAGTRSEDVALNEEEEQAVISRLHQVLRPFLLRRKKAEVETELPAKSEVVLLARLSAWQQHYYARILAAQRVCATDGGDPALGNRLQNRAMQLRTCCNHPYLFMSRAALGAYAPGSPEEVIRVSGKLELLHRILPKLKAANHRCLLFSQMTRVLDIVEYYCAHNGHSYLRLDGSTGTQDRRALLEAFNAPDSPHFLFLLSTRAGGQGLNLQSADTVIMFDSDWNPQADAQAEDRAHRIGQLREVRVLVLVSEHTIEEVILDRARHKRAVDAKVIQAGLFNGRSDADERRAALAAIFAPQQEGDSGPSAAPSDDEEDNNLAVGARLNTLLARTDEELELFQTMDEDDASAGRRPLGLMRHDELPAWVTSDVLDQLDARGDGEPQARHASGRPVRMAAMMRAERLTADHLRDGDDLNADFLDGSDEDGAYEAEEQQPLTPPGELQAAAGGTLPPPPQEGQREPGPGPEGQVPVPAMAPPPAPGVLADGCPPAERRT